MGCVSEAEVPTILAACQRLWRAFLGSSDGSEDP